MSVSRRIFPLATLALVAGCARASTSTSAPASRPSSPSPSMTAIWGRLARELPGTWAATGENEGLIVRYRLVSGGSALLETFGAAQDRQTISVYHPDGTALRMTHYCGQGNQARLQASEATAARVRFVFTDASNVDVAGSVLHDFTFELGGDTLERVEVYRGADGREETGRYHFVRAQDAANGVGG